MVFALGGPAAIIELEKGPFDVVVSDMRMPTVDGAALLAHVKACYPGAARIVLSGHAEREAVVRALPVAHAPTRCIGSRLVPGLKARATWKLTGPRGGATDSRGSDRTA